MRHSRHEIHWQQADESIKRSASNNRLSNDFRPLKDMIEMLSKTSSGFNQ